MRELTGRRPGHAGPAVRPDDPSGADRDLRDCVVELLVRHDPPVPGSEERVVRPAERDPGWDPLRSWEAPDHPLRRRDEKDAVVVAVGDQHVTGHRTIRDPGQSEDSLGGPGGRQPVGAEVPRDGSLGGRPPGRRCVPRSTAAGRKSEEQRQCGRSAHSRSIAAAR